MGRSPYTDVSWLPLSLSNRRVSWSGNGVFIESRHLFPIAYVAPATATAQ